MPRSYRLEAQERNVGYPASSPCAASITPPNDVGVVFRHSGWKPDRDLIRDALARCDASQSRLDAWDGCGCDAWVMRSKDDRDRLKIASSTCKDRFCIPCGNTRSAGMGNRIRDKVPSSGISFLTLTLADSELSLADGLDKLIRSFRTLRTWRRWKQAVAGGVAFIEIKWNEALSRWHPHLHAIMEAGYLPKAEISDQWKLITKTAFIVHIKRPKNVETVIRYCTKYASKSLDQSFVANPDRLDEAIRALKGRHLASTFGTWRDWVLTDDDEHEEWQPIDTLESLLRREARGDPDAVAIMEQLRCSTRKTITMPKYERAPPPLGTLEEISLRGERSIASTAVITCLISLGKSSKEPPCVQLAFSELSPVV